jgi:uncharacterized protein YbjT (DUF2867 family)
MSILVIGGTGTVGSEVVARLLEAGAETRVLVRSPEKAKSLPAGAKAAAGSLEDIASLSAAMEGVDGIFLITPLGPLETAMGITAVRAAQQAAVKRLVYLSVFHVEEGRHIPHFGSKIPVEIAVQESGVTYTILRPNEFFQNDRNLKQAITEYGLYPFPTGDIGVNRVDVRDIAEAAVNALTQSGHEDKTYPLVGPEVFTGKRIAEVYRRLLGRPVHYGGNDLDAWAGQAKQMMPMEMVEDLCIMFGHFHKEGMLASEEDHKQRDEILGHAPRRFEDFARELLAT